MGAAIIAGVDAAPVLESAEHVLDLVPGALDCQASGGRYGAPDLKAESKQFGGYFELDSVNRGLLGGLLPTLVHIQASDPAAGRLKRTIDAIVEEALSDRPGRDLVVDRLIEVLLMEALRFRAEGVGAIGQPGLLVGLADPLLAVPYRASSG